MIIEDDEEISNELNELVRKGYLMKGGRWYDCKIHEVTQVKYEMIEHFSKKYNIKSLCLVLEVSKSGYYKWIKNKDVLNQYEFNRKDFGELIKENKVMNIIELGK